VTGKRSGQGEYLDVNGDQYLGEWSSDDRNGFGTFKSTRGQGSYYGLWADGKRHGKGELVFDNGDVYAGSFERNKLHGYGVMTYAKGHKYVGEWRNNHRDGEGQLSDGCELYQGYWSMGERHGFGKQVILTCVSKLPSRWGDAPCPSPCYPPPVAHRPQKFL
jgi:hypothetical protein